jgi:hypothetical protein
MMDYFLNTIPSAENVVITEEDIREISLISEARYRTWEWNWAYGPDYQVDKQFDYHGNRVWCRMTVKEGRISECVLEGHPGLEVIAEKLIGIRHMVDDLKDIFRKGDIRDMDIFTFF